MSRLLLLMISYYLNHTFELHHTLRSFFVRLDSIWYLGIAESGYNTGENSLLGLRANYVFFPLLPLCIKGGVFLTGLPADIIGLMITNGCFLIASFLLYQLIDQEFGESTARIGVFILNFTPYIVYFTAVYTESLFLVISLACWLSGKKKAWGYLGLFGGLLSLTRPLGVTILLPAFLFAREDYHLTKKSLFNYLPLLLIPLGLILYMVYLHVHTGDALSFFHNQRHWVHRKGWPLHGFWQAFFGRLSWDGQVYNFELFILGLCLSLFLVFEGYYKEALIIPLMTLPALWTGVFFSLARFTATQFTFYFALARLAQQLFRNKLLLHILILAFFLLFTSVFLCYWFTNRFAIF